VSYAKTKGHWPKKIVDVVLKEMVCYLQKKSRSTPRTKTTQSSGTKRAPKYGQKQIDNSINKKIPPNQFKLSDPLTLNLQIYHTIPYSHQSHNQLKRSLRAHETHPCICKFAQTIAE
jgi:hypothetical protein